jgi:hypothetical protein
MILQPRPICVVLAVLLVGCPEGKTPAPERQEPASVTGPELAQDGGTLQDSALPETGLAVVYPTATLASRAPVSRPAPAWTGSVTRSARPSPQVPYAFRHVQEGRRLHCYRNVARRPPGLLRIGFVQRGRAYQSYVRECATKALRGSSRHSKAKTGRLDALSPEGLQRAPSSIVCFGALRAPG